jgi:ParB/RepB/Spo0J family partition protein
MTARKTPASTRPPDPVAPAGDSAGITSADSRYGATPQLRLDQLAPHPANPRTDLGDLGDLQASIAEVGVLEPLVVATVAAHLAGGWPAVAEDATHVVLAGHRRRAAAIGAGQEEAPIVVRDDLAGDDALVVMAAENDPAKRHGLTPLAEAGVFEQLAGRGWSQRQIAARMGCGQAHVSKRLALLKLPGEARDALAAGKITAADAGELVRLAGQPERAVQALKQIGANDWDTAPAVVARALAQAEADQQRAEVLAGLEAEGISVVDPADLGPRSWSRRLPEDADLAPHQEAGCLQGVVRSGVRELYCADPASHEGTAAALPGAAQAADSAAAEAARAEEDRQSAAAARTRKAAAARLAARPVSAPRAADLVSLAMIARHADAQCLETAVKWLRAAEIGPAEGDYYAYADQVTGSGDLIAIRRLAVAMALASDERPAGGQGGFAGRWDSRQVAYVDRLIAEGGYEPGEWEQGRLEEARSRVAARPGMSCSVCGCRPGKTCNQWIRLPGGGYAKCDAEPAEDGSWAYRCACGGKPAAGEDPAGEDESDAREDLYEALESLLIAVDPSTPAGQELPADIDEAINDAAAEFGSWWEAQAGDHAPAPEMLAAAQDLHAALPLEADWSPQLRAAFFALAGCGVIAGQMQGASHG